MKNLNALILDSKTHQLAPFAFLSSEDLMEPSIDIRVVEEPVETGFFNSKSELLDSIKIKSLKSGYNAIVNLAISKTDNDNFYATYSYALALKKIKLTKNQAIGLKARTLLSFLVLAIYPIAFYLFLMTFDMKTGGQ